MKTDRLQIRNKFIKEENKPYIMPNNDDHNYTRDYVKWLEDKLVNNINYTRCSTQLPNKDEIYSTACEYARNVQNPNRNIILTLRQVLKNGAMFIKNKLDD